MKNKKQLAEFLSEELHGVLIKTETIYDLLKEFQSKSKENKEEEDRKMSYEEYKEIEDRIIEKNKKDIAYFRKSILDDIENLEIGLSMGAYLLVQNEVPRKIMAGVIEKRLKEEEEELNDAILGDGEQQ